MAEPLADRVIQSIEQVTELYHRLVLLVAPPRSGKTMVLQEVRDRTKAPLLNVNLELSGRMLELTERQRTLQLPRLLSEMVNEASSDVVQLDNIEMLFDASLKQDPLRLFQSLSRNRTIVVAWPGSLDDRYLTYASAEHPEYRRYGQSEINSFLSVSDAL